MLLCVVGNCLLSYCSCTGNCENCCVINGLLRIANIDQDGKVDGNNILNKAFVNGKKKASVNVSIYRGSTEKEYKAAKDEFLNSIDTTGETTYLSAYVEVGDTTRYFIHCKDANSKEVGKYYYGLFQGSKATKIVILSCGNNITDMSLMFFNCSSLKNLDLSNFNTKNVTDMRSMFYNCSSLKELDLSKFNTNNVTYMSNMFDSCSSLTKLDLSQFNTDNVTDMIWMFYNCFKNNATLICQASTIKKITDKGGLRLTIQNENKYEIKNIIENNKNLEQVYTCIVKRDWNEDNPQITSVEEYQQQ